MHAEVVFRGSIFLTLRFTFCCRLSGKMASRVHTALADVHFSSCSSALVASSSSLWRSRNPNAHGVRWYLVAEVNGDFKNIGDAGKVDLDLECDRGVFKCPKEQGVNSEQWELLCFKVRTALRTALGLSETDIRVIKWTIKPISLEPLCSQCLLLAMKNFNM